MAHSQDDEKRLDEALRRLEAALAEAGVPDVALPPDTDRSLNRICMQLADWSTLLTREAQRVKRKDARLHRQLTRISAQASDVRGKLLRARLRQLPAELAAASDRFDRASRRVDAIARDLSKDMNTLSTVARVINYAAQAASAIWSIVRALVG